MSLIIVLSLLAVALTALASRSAPRPAPVRLLDPDRVEDRQPASAAVPIDRRCGYTPGGPIRDPSSW